MPSMRTQSWFRSLRRPCRTTLRGALRGGFTVVELLIAMAITLLMMAAVVNLFANLSSSVRDRRAMIEVSGQLRQARLRLARDLAGATCPPQPWRRPEANEGYLEIVEGFWRDWQPSGLTDRDVNGINGELDYSASLAPGSQRVLAEGGVDLDGDGLEDVTDAAALGDYDDILALTVRSEGEPFVGRGPGGTTIESHLAEVIWYAVENPLDGSLGEPGLRRIYRRVLLVAPWLEKDLPLLLRQASANDFFREVDISCRWTERPFDTDNDPSTPPEWLMAWTPNTLGDLTKRENRFAHVVQYNGNPGARFPVLYPHRLDTSAIRLDPLGLDASATPRFPTNSASPLHPFGLPFEYDPNDSFNRTDVNAFPTAPPLSFVSGLILDRTGEDLMLDNALAFDVRVFDPGAPLADVSGVIVEPSDVGWRNGGWNASQVVGFGAYADLGWNANHTWNGYWLADAASYAANPQGYRVWQDAENNAPRVLFGMRPAPKSLLDRAGSDNAYREVVYDGWSLHYEHDGLDTDGDGIIDEGTNGLDDDNLNGVDDPGERETAPPYAAPLRGIHVRLRVYEQEARQVRETSVIQDF
jgi:type II secretory pathway component PulJ